jgi:amylovoran biosynthesis glycosyltransferase AmsB
VKNYSAVDSSRFTIVIPTFNSSTTVAVPIDALNRQTYRDFDVIICDDRSDDYEALMLLVSSRCNFRYQVLRLPAHMNASAARNFGALAASGEYICFLDSDDDWSEDKLCRVNDQIIRNKLHGQIAICFHQMTCCKENGREFTYPHRGIRANELVADYLFLSNGLIHPSSLTCSRELFDQVCFDEAMTTHEDWQFVIDAQAKGVKFIYLDLPLGRWMVRRAAGNRVGRDASSASLQW